MKEMGTNSIQSGASSCSQRPVLLQQDDLPAKYTSPFNEETDNGFHCASEHSPAHRALTYLHVLKFCLTFPSCSDAAILISAVKL